MTKPDCIPKAEYPSLIRAAHKKYGHGPWVYADLVAVGEDMGLKLYPSILYILRIDGWVHPVTEDGSVLRRQRHGSRAGPKLWAVSITGAKKSGAAGVTV